MAEQLSLTVAADEQVELCARWPSALLGPTAVAAVRAEPIALSRQATASQALAVVATSCLRQIVQNQAGVRHGFGEALHQMRVGVRRLRSALSIFSGVLGKGEFDGLKAELVWLTEQLAVARDYDVFLASMHHLEDALPSAPLGRAELAQMLADRRQEGFAIASSAAASVRFQRLILSSACALIARADGEAGAGIPARDLARTVLEHRTQRVLHRLGRFARLSVRERHELRIQVKKLRYGTDFFATLFSKTNRARQRFSRELEALQDVLGRLNDIAVHRRIARELIAGGTSEGCGDRRIAFAMGALAGKEQAESGSLPAAVPKLRARLAKAPRFWR